MSYCVLVPVHVLILVPTLGTSNWKKCFMESGSLYPVTQGLAFGFPLTFLGSVSRPGSAVGILASCLVNLTLECVLPILESLSSDPPEFLKMFCRLMVFFLYSITACCSCLWAVEDIETGVDSVTCDKAFFPNYSCRVCGPSPLYSRNASVLCGML